MGSKTIHYCDGCGREKQDTNHWWASSIEDCCDCGGGFVLRVFAKSRFGDRLYCGQECASKAMSEYMEQVSGFAKK